MEIKPIQRVQKIQQSEMPDSKINANAPRAPARSSSPAETQSAWRFTNGRLTLKGQEIGDLVQQSLHEPAAFWSKLAGELEAFRQEYFRKHSRIRKKKTGDRDVDEDLDPTGELGQLAALVEAYVAKISRILKRKYDEKADGISFSLDEDGQLILNGMNVTAFIQTAQNFPNQKAKIFLKGLKNRLSHLLSNRQHNPNYEKVRDKTLELIQDIDLELQRITDKDRLLEKP